MLTNPTIDMLRELGLSGMASAFHELEVQPDVRSLEHGEWLFLELPSQQPLHFGPVPARPTRGEHAAKRREEMEARLQRIAAKLGTADRDEFENGIEAWTPPWLGARRPSILFLSEITNGSG